MQVQQFAQANLAKPRQQHDVYLCCDESCAKVPALFLQFLVKRQDTRWVPCANDYFNRTLKQFFQLNSTSLIDKPCACADLGNIDVGQTQPTSELKFACDKRVFECILRCGHLDSPLLKRNFYCAEITKISANIRARGAFNRSDKAA